MKFSAVFLDVDDVMLDMDRIAHLGVESVEVPLRQMLGAEPARAIQRSFAHYYDVLIEQLRSKGGTTDAFAELRAEIEKWQEGFVETKIFSRHVLMAIALEKHGHPVTAALVHGAVDHYWRTLSDRTEVFADAAGLIARLQRDGTPFQLATNSDGFLIFEDAAGRFRYDPPDAVAKKHARLGTLNAIGIPNTQITVGDPIGKPDPRFYTSVLDAFERRTGHAPDLSRAIAVGDSLTSDVLPFLELGVPYGAWIRRDRTEPPAFLENQVAVISDLTQLWTVVWPDV